MENYGNSMELRLKKCYCSCSLALVTSVKSSHVIICFRRSNVYLVCADANIDKNFIFSQNFIFLNARHKRFVKICRAKGAVPMVHRYIIAFGWLADVRKREFINVVIETLEQISSR